MASFKENKWVASSSWFPNFFHSWFQWKRWYVFKHLSFSIRGNSHRKFRCDQSPESGAVDGSNPFCCLGNSTSVQLELKDANSIGVFRNLVEVYCILIFGRMVIFVPTLGPMKNEDSNEVFVFFFFWLIRFQLVVSRSCAAGFQHLRQSRKSPNFCIEKNSGVTVFSGRFFQGLLRNKLIFFVVFWTLLFFVDEDPRGSKLWEFQAEKLQKWIRNGWSPNDATCNVGCRTSISSIKKPFRNEGSARNPKIPC